MSGARLNESVTAGNWLWWVSESAVIEGDLGDDAHRHLVAGGRADEELLDGVRVGGEIRLHLQDDVVLPVLVEVGRHLPLAEGVVERVVDVLGEDAQPRGGVAVDLHVHLQAGDLEIGGDVLELGQLLQHLDHLGRPGAQLVHVGVLEGVLVLRPRRPTAGAEVLHRLEVGHDPRDLGELGAQAGDDLIGGGALHVAAQLYEAGAGVAAGDEGDHVLHRRVRLDHVVDGLLPRLHRGEGGVLGGVGGGHHRARVLLGEEALGDDDQEVDVERQRGEGDEEGEDLVAEHPAQTAGVGGDHPLEEALGEVVEAPVLLLALGLEQAGAHHRRQGQGDDGRDGDGDAQGDGELAEEAPDDAPHEEDGDEHRQERDGDGDDGEADLLGPLERRVVGRLALLDEAGHVLGHHDGVVDDEARGDGERHQRQVVEAVAEQVHHAERRQERERHGHAGDDRRPPVAEEHEDDHHHQGDAEHQGELDVVHRGADGLGPVEPDGDLDRRRDGVAQRGEDPDDPVDGLDDVGPGLAPDDEHHRALAVDPAGGAVVLDVVDDRGHVAEAHREPPL